MKRSFTYALGGHLLILLLLWLSGQTFYKPTRIQGYPTKINARVVEKNTIQQRSQRPPSLPKQEAAKPKVQPEPKKTAPTPKKQAAKPKAKPQNQQSAPAAAAAPAANSLSLDAQDFPFPEYLLLMQYRVERQWNPPRAALAGKSALIYFRLERNGKVAEAKVERSSGNFAFDQAALRAVYSADPLPALPEESSLNTLGVHFEFVGN
ncbi:MAG: energy transducer TonB [Calditrichia bacterium]